MSDIGKWGVIFDYFRHAEHESDNISLFEKSLPVKSEKSRKTLKREVISNFKMTEYVDIALSDLVLIRLSLVFQ